MIFFVVFLNILQQVSLFPWVVVFVGALLVFHLTFVNMKLVIYGRKAVKLDFVFADDGEVNVDEFFRMMRRTTYGF